jgi:hypothetical protein
MKERQTTSLWLNPEPLTEIDNLPDPNLVGSRAVQILEDIQASEYYDRLVTSTGFYCDGWGTVVGYASISNWNLETDFEGLFTEGLRVMCLKAAVYELTGDEEAAELVISAPVDEMTHAIIAQYMLLRKIERTVGTEFVHMTDRERFGYQEGNYSDQCYAAAGWGTPNPRYWYNAQETARRVAILNREYEKISIHNLLRSHDIDFSVGVAA